MAGLSVRCARTAETGMGVDQSRQEALGAIGQVGGNFWGRDGEESWNGDVDDRGGLDMGVRRRTTGRSVKGKPD